MLRELRIKNYAVIEDLSLRLEPGLNVLTGETGAGKSIIVGALSLLLGERASADVIRAGEDRATIEAVFDIADREDLRRLCDERGIEVEESWIVLKREVQSEGRNRAWINGSPATATMTGEIGRALVDLHGQHEHQNLLHAGPQREILDLYAGADSTALELRSEWDRLTAVRRQRTELEERRARTRDRAEFLRHQLDEIDAAEIRGPAEDEELTSEELRLAHAEELLETAARLYDEIYGAERSLTERLGGMRRDLDGLAKLDPGIANELSELHDSAYYALNELAERLRAYREEIDLDPRRLERVRQRIDLLYRLKSKYGPTLEEVSAAAAEARGELEALDLAAFEAEELEARAAELTARVGDLCLRLTGLREKAARALSSEVSELLPELGMPDGRLTVDLVARDAPGATGAEEIRYLVTLNRGFEPRPLSKVASGGELSRVMLALKTVLARLDRTPTLVFDEIDAGIGGIVGQKVAERLAAVARHHQVFVITHLPQIAARADHHLLVTKRTRARKTSARVAELDGDARVRDIARMLGGDPDRAASLEHARAILAGAVGQGTTAGSDG